VGLRFRLRIELARRLHRVPAAQDGGGRKVALDSDGARRRIRPARTLSFRARLTLVAAAAVALAVVLASIVVWIVVRNQMLGQFDQGLEQQANAISNDPGGIRLGPSPYT